MNKYLEKLASLLKGYRLVRKARISDLPHLEKTWADNIELRQVNKTFKTKDGKTTANMISGAWDNIDPDTDKLKTRLQNGKAIAFLRNKPVKYKTTHVGDYGVKTRYSHDGYKSHLRIYEKE